MRPWPIPPYLRRGRMWYARDIVCLEDLTSMIEQIAEFARPVLEFPLVRRTRRNHALEHATIHVSSWSNRWLRVAGRSSDSGFVLIGDIDTDKVENAVNEALNRMRKGEHHLALHPNCGTNLVTAGVVTTLAGMIGLRGSNKPLTLDRLSWTVMLMMGAIFVSQPLGMSLQKHITTKGEPGDLELVSVARREVRWPFSSGTITLHTIITHNG